MRADADFFCQTAEELRLDKGEVRVEETRLIIFCCFQLLVYTVLKKHTSSILQIIVQLVMLYVR